MFLYLVHWGWTVWANFKNGHSSQISVSLFLIVCNGYGEVFESKKLTTNARTVDSGRSMHIRLTIVFLLAFREKTTLSLQFLNYLSLQNTNQYFECVNMFCNYDRFIIVFHICNMIFKEKIFTFVRVYIPRQFKIRYSFEGFKCKLMMVKIRIVDWK